MIGQRTDVAVEDELEFRHPALQRQLLSRGQLHSVGGIDYLAWRRGSLPSLPALYLGAPWDNRTVFCCRRAGVPVVDATEAARIVHQDHPYQTLADGRSVAHWGPAAQWNRDQIPDEACAFTVVDASRWLDAQFRLHSGWFSVRHACRLMKTWPVSRGWPVSFRRPFSVLAVGVRVFSIGWVAVFQRRRLEDPLLDALLPSRWLSRRPTAGGPAA